MTARSLTPATRPSLKAAFSVVGAARGSERRRWIARIMPRSTRDVATVDAMHRPAMTLVWLSVTTILEAP